MSRSFLAATLLLPSLLLASAATTALFDGGRSPVLAKTAHKGQKPNRLIKESSPYLRQHAYNPVNWFAWGKEAFEKARKENKPILLSVGYSTCHWCHVMERESYSDKAIAKLLNDNFVAIKVDRERRPDVDETYILATEIVTGSSGWPNNVFLTPDLKPFVGGTYFPPEDFKRLLTEVALRWETSEKLLRDEGNRIASIIHRVMSHRVASADVTPKALKAIATQSLKQFDMTYGGLGNRPKFPRESQLLFLLDRAEKNHDMAALLALRKTLDGMIFGGIHDQVGGGFHRYSVDRKWLVPHFEKMLYNQAQIGRVLTQAYRITAQPRYKRAGLALFDFVLRDLLSPQGAFYSAYDADSKRPDGAAEEGFYYLWTEDELVRELGAKDAAFAGRVYGITFEGNFEGRNILHLPKSLPEVAIIEKTTIDVVAARLKTINEKLLKARNALRKLPHRDDKQLTAWNGLMIKALAEGAQTFGVSRYQKAAVRAAEFFWGPMGGSKGQLKRYFYDGAASFRANQADYAALALGFIALYDTTQEGKWLDRAGKLAARMDELFLDKKHNDYFMTAAGGGFYRPKVSTDGDIPSGNAMALEIYSKLSRRQLDPENKARAEAILASISGAAMAQPGGYAYALRAADELLRGETGSIRYLAKGRVRASARLVEDGSKIRVSVVIAKGWHINAHKPLEDYFIPTTLSAGKGPCNNPSHRANGRAENKSTSKMSKSVATKKSTALHELLVNYPIPLKKKLGFNDKPLALYEGDVAFTAQPAQAGVMPRTISFTAQTCSDKICLEPETVILPVLQ